MKFSIRWKILILLIVLVTLPTVFLGINSYRNATRILAQELKLTSLQIIEEADATMDFFMKSVEENLHMLSIDANVEQVLSHPDSLEWMLYTFENYIKSHPDILNVYLGTKNKDMFLYPETSLPEGFDPTLRPWYEAAVRINGLIWTDPYIDAGTGQVVVTAAKPVYDSRNNNQFVGVLGVDVSLDILLKLTNSIRLGENGYVTLTDASGKVMTHPDSNLIGEEIPIPELLGEVLANTKGVIDYDFEGSRSFGVYQTLEKTGWKLIGIVQYSEIQKMLQFFCKVL